MQTSHHKLSLKTNDFLSVSANHCTCERLGKTVHDVPYSAKKIPVHYYLHFMSILIPLLSGSCKIFFTWESCVSCSSYSEPAGQEMNMTQKTKAHCPSTDPQQRAKPENKPAGQDSALTGMTMSHTEPTEARERIESGGTAKASAQPLCTSFWSSHPAGKKHWLLSELQTREEGHIILSHKLI